MTNAGSMELDQAPAMPQADGSGLVDGARNAGVILLAGVAIGAGVVGAAIRGFVVTGAAEAQTPVGSVLDAHEPIEAEASRTRQVEEFAKVVTKNAAGGVTATRAGVFVLLEQCKDGAKPVSRKVVVSKADQPLGDCNVGSKVTVTYEKPLSGNWKNHSATKQTLKATRGNNHRFLFIEQDQPVPVPTVTATPVPTPNVPANPAEPAPGTPTPPVTPPGTPPVITPPNNPYASGKIGADISWAQCSGSSNTVVGSVANFSFGVIDIEDGLGYSANPCLASEVNDFTSDGIPVTFYVNTGWYSGSAHVNPNSPTVCATGDEICLARNYGYNNALFAVQTAASEGISVAGLTVGEDLEEDNTWSTGEPTSAQQNEASLEGTEAGLLASGVSKVLFYTNQSAETDIIAGYQNGFPVWFAPGVSTAAAAAPYCTNGEGSVNGGSVYMVQFEGSTTTGTTGIPIDEEVVC